MTFSSKLQIVLIMAIIAFTPLFVNAAPPHSGKIFLQVEANGEAWYVNPTDGNRYYMGRPNDAFSLMRTLGLGISEENIAQIPIGYVTLSGTDSDGDGLTNDFETAIGTSLFNPDSDNDDFSDKTEILSWHDPKGNKTLKTNTGLINNLKGRILIQTEKNGEAWYLNPSDSKRYYLGRPADAFQVMRELGIGITNANLNALPSSYLKETYKTSGHYDLKYPSGWYITYNDEKDVYKGTTIKHQAQFHPMTSGGVLKVVVLDSEKDFTLNTITNKQISKAELIKEYDVIVDIKPTKKQKFVYNSAFIKDEIPYNKGAELIGTVMISTRKFIQLQMTVFDESSINTFEDYFDQILNDLTVTK